VGFSQNDENRPGGGDEQGDADQERGNCHVLALKIIDHPDGKGGDGIGNERQKSSAAVQQSFTVPEQQGKDDHRQENADRPQFPPVGNADNRLNELKFWLPLVIVHPPQAAGLSFQLFLPDLIEGLHDVIGVAVFLGHIEKTAEKLGLIGRAGHRSLADAAAAWPSHLADDDLLARIGLFEFVVAHDAVIDGLIDGNAFPVGKKMDGDKVDMLNQLGVFQPDVPGFGGADRCNHRLLDPVDVFDHLIDCLIGTQEHLVADHDTNDVAVVLMVNLDQFGDFFLIALSVWGDPGAENDIQPPCRCQTWDFRQVVFNGIGTYSMNIAGQNGQIPVYLLNRGINSFAWRLVFLERREGKPLNFGGP